MMQTETAAARFATMEDWSTLDLVDGIVEGQFAAIACVHASREKVAETIDRAAKRIQRGGRLIYLGAGTSGRIATQDAAELPPTFDWAPERAVSLMAGGDTAFISAVEGAEDGETEAPARLTEIGVGPDDVVLGIAASGRTPFTISGLVHAREKGALTVGIQNNRGGQIGAVSDIEILLDTGPELLAGSTRMKAGTAQKAVLNAISTGIMIRLGAVYRGLMVEMRVTNGKLRGRAVEMVSQLSGAPAGPCEAALRETDWSIKRATVMLAKGLDREGADAVLELVDGNLRRAMEG